MSTRSCSISNCPHPQAVEVAWAPVHFYEEDVVATARVCWSCEDQTKRRIHHLDERNEVIGVREL